MQDAIKAAAGWNMFDYKITQQIIFTNIEYRIYFEGNNVQL